MRPRPVPGDETHNKPCAWMTKFFRERRSADLILRCLLASAFIATQRTGNGICHDGNRICSKHIT